MRQPEIDPATVTIEKAPPVEGKHRTYHVRGRQIIKVAGVPYGRIEMSQHGGRGNSYTFEQIGGETIQRKDSGTGRQERWSTVKVYGDKMENRMRPHTAPPLDPIAKRLHAMAVELVQSGELRSEQAQAALVAERRRKMAEGEQRHAEAKKQKFRNKAREALAELPDAETCIERIVEAMEWAQSQ